MDDRPWPEMQSGKAITTNKLTRTLKPLDICRKQWRIGGTDERPWGFYLADFADAFERYLAADPKSEDQGLSGKSPEKVVTQTVCHQNEYPEISDISEYNQLDTGDVTTSPLFPEDYPTHAQSPAAWTDDPATPAW